MHLYDRVQSIFWQVPPFTSFLYLVSFFFFLFFADLSVPSRVAHGKSQAKKYWVFETPSSLSLYVEDTFLGPVNDDHSQNKVFWIIRQMHTDLQALESIPDFYECNMEMKSQSSDRKRFQNQMSFTTSGCSSRGQKCSTHSSKMKVDSYDNKVHNINTLAAA